MQISKDALCDWSSGCLYVRPFLIGLERTNSSETSFKKFIIFTPNQQFLFEDELWDSLPKDSYLQSTRMKNEAQELMLPLPESIEAPGEARFDFGSTSLDLLEESLSGEMTYPNINMDDNDELAKKINNTVDFSELNTPDIQIDAPDEPFQFPSSNESSLSEQPFLMNNTFVQENKTTESNSEKTLDYQDYSANSPELLIAPRENSVESIQKDQYHDVFLNDNNLYKILVENVCDTSTKPLLLHTIEHSKRNNNNSVKPINNEAGKLLDFQSSSKQEAIDTLSSNILQPDVQSHNLLEDSSKYTQKSGMQDQINELVNSFLKTEDSNTEETNDVKFVKNRYIR
ncbi:hypothetical protein Anas_13957, partial [Armadillidium nasatum]